MDALTTVVVIVAAVVVLALVVKWVKTPGPEQASTHVDDIGEQWYPSPHAEQEKLAEPGAEDMNASRVGDSADVNDLRARKTEGRGRLDDGPAHG